jgi:hypothetical protein
MRIAIAPSAFLAGIELARSECGNRAKHARQSTFKFILHVAVGGRPDRAGEG